MSTRRDAALQPRRCALLDNVLGRVHAPGVDVAGLGPCRTAAVGVLVLLTCRTWSVDRPAPTRSWRCPRLGPVTCLGPTTSVSVGRLSWSWNVPSICGVRGPVTTNPRCAGTACGYSTWSITRGRTGWRRGRNGEGGGGEVGQMGEGLKGGRRGGGRMWEGGGGSRHLVVDFCLAIKAGLTLALMTERGRSRMP